MNQKDYSNLLDKVSDIIIPINQLLYQSIILIILYYYFNGISSNIDRDLDKHKSFTYLFIIICIFIDWNIWHNHIQTSLFLAILILYVMYNFKTAKSVSSFIKTMNQSKQNSINNKKILIHNEKTKNDTINNSNINLKKITLIPQIPQNIQIQNSIHSIITNNQFNKYNDLDIAFHSNMPNTPNTPNI